MEIGLVGLGKMGLPLALNLLDHGFDVTAFDVQEAVCRNAVTQGVKTVSALEEITAALSPRRVIWLMVPAGADTDQAIHQLLPFLNTSDILIDGGNSNFKDSIRRHQMLAEMGIDFLDCGTSGGISGARHGACTMIGGERAVYDYCKPVFDALSQEGGSLYAGSAGSGHFVKMVHNGIEYGMMQAIAEGFEMLERSGYEMDIKAIADLWNHGSVIRGWLMELTASAFSKDPHLEGIKGVMHASGEGRWALDTALDLGVPAPVMALSLMMRQRSQQEETFAGKVVAALRNEFGGHAVEKK